MSLTSLIRNAEVQKRFAHFRPKGPRRITVPIRVLAKSNRRPLIGAAFDYLIRFEIHRRYPRAVSGAWTAELAVEELHEPGVLPFDVFSVDPDEFIELASSTVKQAREKELRYRMLRRPKRSDTRKIAEHCLLLAHLDRIVREHQIDVKDFRRIDREEPMELLRLLDCVPFETLLPEEPILLNPYFGESSVMVGGSDADLIAGSMLIDFKTSEANAIAAKYLDQLLGYFLLSRREATRERTFPKIKTVALYFARHGYLWTLDTSYWLQIEDFGEFEDWFFRYAAKAFTI